MLHFGYLDYKEDAKKNKKKQSYRKRSFFCDKQNLLNYILIQLSNHLFNADFKILCAICETIHAPANGFVNLFYILTILIFTSTFSSLSQYFVYVHCETKPYSKQTESINFTLIRLTNRLIGPHKRTCGGMRMCLYISMSSTAGSGQHMVSVCLQ